MKYLVSSLMMFWPFAALAQPSSLADCERIKNDLAYNQCLASFGPKHGERPAREGADQDGEGSTARSPAPRRRGGRQSAAFDVVSGRGGARPPGPVTVRRR
jgi:hypothetical protein